MLEDVRADALSLKAGAANLDCIRQISRAFHTAHSLALVVGFEDLAAFTTHLEDLLTQLREGLVPVTDPVPGILVAAADQIRLLLHAAQGGPPIDFSLQAALLEAVFQMLEPSVSVKKARELDQEASVQDAIVLQRPESVSAG